MMNQGTSFLKRFFALVMALALIVSGSNLGAVLQVSAGEAKTTKTAGELVAENYTLTDAEKELLRSGLLVGETYTFTTPENSDNLIAVDTENAKITAKSYKTGSFTWVPTKAYIVAGGETKQTVTLTDGVGSYDPSVGNAFSVKVDYVLEIAVSETTQNDLLNAAKWLNAGIANLKSAYNATDANLGTIVAAMPTLVQLADGIKFAPVPSMPTFIITFSFQEPAKSSVYALNSEMNANGGKLKLQVMNEAYAAASSKVQYLVENGAEYLAALQSTYTHLMNINNDAAMKDVNVDSYLQSNDPSNFTLWKAFKAILNNTVTGMSNAVAADWTATTKTLVKSGLGSAEYVALDSLLAKITSNSSAAVKANLVAGKTTLQDNLSMFNVTVKVSLKLVKNEPDCNELYVYDTQTEVLTLPEGATQNELRMAIGNVVAEAQKSWGEAFDSRVMAWSMSALPETLTEDITFETTYSPMKFAVTGALDEIVYYGYQLTLPAHSDPTKAYDYTVNGKAYAQGEVVVIEGNTEIKRTSGKAYASSDLYTVVAENYGNPFVQAILKSGALKDNTVINVRKPDPADAASLLQLLDGKVTADDYSAAYAGLSWKPYSYGAEGTENPFSGNEASWGGKSVKVQYRLNLTNFSVAEVKSILDLAVTLKAEAAEQKSAMDGLASLESTLAMLDKTKLGGMNGVIDVTDFSADPVENEEIKAELKSVVSAIIANNLDGNNLRIYSIVVAYNNDGMTYYYKNYDAIKNEVNTLAGYMTKLMDNEEALKIMCTAAQFPEYADKIADVEGKLNDYNARLSAPNAAIDVDSPNLNKLVTALVAEGEASYNEPGYAYMNSELLTALDESQVMVQVIIETPNGNATLTSAEMDKGTVLTQAVIDNLKTQVNAKVIEMLGATSVGFYDCTVEGTALDSLVGKELNENVNTYYTYEAKEYVVKIAGEADQVITINDMEINLPKHPVNGYEYRYTVDGVSEITTSAYTFTVEQLSRLFKGGVYTITRVEINEAAEKVEATFGEWLQKDENGNATGLYAKVEGNQGGIMDFAMTIVNSGYSYIALNGEALLYMNSENTLEICLQTLVNAILTDNQFGSETLINLGKNGKGEFVHASMQLGNSADDIVFEDLDFTLYLNSVPGQMATVSNGLSTIKPYMTFKSNNGELDINLNLPEKVYEIYLAGMLVTGNVDKDNMDAINSEIAFQFFYDYIEYILASDANTTSFSNTLKMLGQNRDLTGYEKYYQMVKSAMTNEGVKINADRSNGIFEMSVEGKSQAAINKVINLLGVDVSAYDMYLGMIKEYKYADATLKAAAKANLVNTDSGFEAMLLDLNASGVANKFDFTKDLPARCKSIAGTAAVILLNDIDGNLVFNGTTILDLNGQTVHGNIIANGNVIIIDSAFDTYNGGLVEGTVSGKATIIGGNFASDVSAFVKNGYKQVNGAVQNVLFTVETNGDDLTYVINTDFLDDAALEGYIPDAKSLAVEIAMDLLLNYYTAAAITADGNTIYNLHVDDLLALYASANKTDDLIQVVLDCINLPDLSNFTNIILEDLLDFDAIADALENNKSVATYTITTAPWALNLKHETNGDYITVGFGANNKVRASGKAFNVSLKFNGDNKEKVVDELRELGEITEGTYAKIDLQQPVYDGATNSLYFVGSAEAHAELALNEKDVYANILALILANGNPDAKAELVSAVNSGDRVALKAAIDKMTVADLIAAMKALNRNESFEAIAAKLGVTADVSKDTDLEKAAHLLLTAMGKALEKLDITGMNSKFGALDKDGDGIYEFSADATRNPSASAAGYTFYVEASAKVSATVNLFDEPECLWGDVDHDGDVDITDAEYAMMKALGAPLSIDYCMKRGDVDCDGKITVIDAEYIMMYALGAPVVFPAVH